MKKIFFLILLILSSLSSYSQISISDNQTAATLAQKLVGYGVTIANPVLDCQGISNGTFNVTSSNLGLDSGIILTTGRSMTNGLNTGANGPSTGFASNVSWTIGNGNDPDLDIITSPSPTRDRCILEFDFTTIGDTVKFDYVFASEEYPGFTCSPYFDAFGFFISGPGISGPFSLSSQNIALVPGTSCPVGINTINGSTSNPCGSVVAPCAPPNNALFNTNAGGTSVTYSGFTHVLTAVSAVIPCSTYHIKLAIADGNDHVLDSGVWLKAGSFSSNIINIKLKTGLSSTYPYIIEGCDSAKLTLTRTIVLGTPYADTVHLLIAGNAINGTDYAYLQNTVIFTANLLDTTRTLDLYAFQDGLNEGSELIKIYVLSGCAQVITDSIIIEIRDSLSFNLFNSDTAICLGGMVNINGQVDSGISILWSPPNGVTDINTLLTQISPTTIGSQYYFATGTYATCTPVTKGFTITTDPQPILSHIDDIEVCEGIPYNITALVSPPFNYITNWLPSTNLSNQTGYNTTFIGNTSQYINFEVVSPNAGCKADQTFFVKVWPFAKGNIRPDTVICDGSIAQLWVTGGNGQYFWYPSNNLSCDSCPNPVINSFSVDRYYVVLLDPHGCQDTLSTLVSYEPPFTMNLLNTDTTIYLGESVQLNVIGTAPFLYWTPTDYLGFSQSNDPVSTPLEDITYTVTGVSLFSGCPLKDSVTIKVIQQDVFIPNAFTPNGDGLNDIFGITSRKLINVQEFVIVNRWGNEVFRTNNIHKGWNGRYNGIDQDSGVYYYMVRVSYPNGKTSLIKGDLTLIR